jgi:hypothetical protein
VSGGEAVPPLDAARAEEAIAAVLAMPEFAGYAAFEPYLERVALFRGTTFLVKFRKTPPREGGERPFLFQKAVVKEYRRLTGE